jgi:predicted DNA-binding antitoxin AbrB/MazE fold protein
VLHRRALSLRESAMPLTVEAIYENGVLKPTHPLPLKEHERVQVTVHTAPDLIQRTYGVIGWEGDHETLERILAEAEEPEELP